MSTLKAETVTITNSPDVTREVWHKEHQKESLAVMVFDIPPGKREVEAGAGRHIARAVKGAVSCWGREDGHWQLNVRLKSKTEHSRKVF